MGNGVGALDRSGSGLDGGRQTVRAALYARVSTEEQAARYGLASQLTELRALAANRGYTIPEGGEFVDDGCSGADLDRPALTRLRDAVRLAAFQVVIIHDPDRLSRRLAHQLLLVEEFERAGVRLEFLTTPSEETPEGRLLLQVKGVVAEYERAKIRERTLRGKREKARRGLIPAGPIPYGYRQDSAVPGRLVAHEDEASVVRLIFRWLVDEGRSVRAIVGELRRLGVRPRRSRQWARSSVRRMLTDPLYIGRAYFNRRQRVGDAAGHQVVRFRDEKDWIALTVPALVSPEVYQAAQRQLERNRATGRPPRYVYLLRGLLRCGTCGRSYYGVPSHGRPFYRCAGRDRLAGGGRCRAPVLSAGRLEAFVWETVSGVLRQPGLLTEKIEAHQRALGVRQVEVLSEVEYLARQFGDFERQGERLLDLYLDGGIPKGLLQKRLEGFESQKAELSARLAQARQRAASHAAEAAHRDAVARYCRLALRGLERLTAEGRQRLLRALVDAIVLRGNMLELHGLLPGRWVPPFGAGKRADHEDVVAAGRGDLERPLGVSLSPDLREVHVVCRGLARRGVRVHTGRLDRPLAAEPLDRFAEAPERERREVPDHRGLAAVGGGEQKAVEAFAPAGQGDREHAPHGMDLAVQRQLADQEKPAQRVPLHEPRGGEDPEGDGEVEGRAFLSEVGWREAHRDALHGEGIAGVPDGAPDAIAALADGGVGEADHVESRQSRGDIDLHRDHCRVDSGHGGREHPGQHGRDSRLLTLPGQRPEWDTSDFFARTSSKLCHSATGGQTDSSPSSPNFLQLYGFLTSALRAGMPICTGIESAT